MADEDTSAKAATAAETAAAQALKASEQADMTDAEKAASDTTQQQAAQAEETAQMIDKPQDDGEKHVVSDLMPAASRLYGVPPEVVAGAAHFAGLEMTSEVSIPELAGHIKSFMDQPA